MQRICHPPASNGNRSPATQHAAEISSGLETTEHLPSPSGTRACQLPGPASCSLMNPHSPFKLAEQTFLYGRRFCHPADGRLFCFERDEREVINSCYPDSTIFLAIAQGPSLNVASHSYLKSVSQGTSQAPVHSIPV